MPALAAIWPLLKVAAASWQYILIGVLLIGVLWFRSEARDCEAGRAADKAAQAQAVLEAQQKADALSARLVAGQQEHRRQLEEATQSVRERIVRVPVSTVCRDSPAIRSAIDGVLELQRGPGGKAP